MAVVTVEINGRAYQIACHDGEEDRVRNRAGELDQRVRRLAAAVGQVGDPLLLVMTGLLLSDELAEAQARQAPPAPGADAQGTELDAALASTIEALAARIDGIAERLQKP